MEITAADKYKLNFLDHLINNTNDFNLNIGVISILIKINKHLIGGTVSDLIKF